MSNLLFIYIIYQKMCIPCFCVWINVVGAHRLKGWHILYSTSSWFLRIITTPLHSPVFTPVIISLA